MTSHTHIPTASMLYVTPETLHVPCVLRLFGHTLRHPIRMRNVLSPDVQCSLPDVFSHLETVTFLSVTMSYVCYPRHCVVGWTAQTLTCNRRKTRQQPNSVSCGHVSVSTPNLNSSISSSNKQLFLESASIRDIRFGLNLRHDTWQRHSDTITDAVKCILEITAGGLWMY